MIPKLLAEICSADLQALLDNGVPEGKTIEYKRDLPGNSDQDKREFLADASSFANAGGGDILFGIAAKKGIPTGFAGIPVEDMDDALQRLESMLRTGIEPRMPGCELRGIALGNGTAVLLIRVRQSWAAPHRVTFKDHSKFYSRNSAGKYGLDVGELRAAFEGGQVLASKVREFREQRLSKVLSGETPSPLVKGAVGVLHVVPLVNFSTNQPIALARPVRGLTPPDSMGWGDRWNLDGILVYSSSKDGGSSSYIQVFRNGPIETATVFDLDRDPPSLPSLHLEKVFIEALEQSVRYLQEVGVEPPLYVFLSLLGIGPYRFAIPNDMGWSGRNPSKLDRRDLILPEVLLEGDVSQSDVALKPIFDLIWNAYGLEKSIYYDEQGRWRGWPR